MEPLKKERYTWGEMIIPINGRKQVGFTGVKKPPTDIGAPKLHGCECFFWGSHVGGDPVDPDLLIATGWALPREQPTCRCLENAHSTDGTVDAS